MITFVLLALNLFSLPTSAAPAPQDVSVAAAATSWYLPNMKHQGKPAFGNNAGDYNTFRNVKDFGAVGNGVADDTDAINRAIAAGNRCGYKCDSQTTTPAIIYFPPGTYAVSRPITPFYYTQLIGDAQELPVIKATANFEGMAVIDADPYDNTGTNWWVNQNNFFRQVRNFVIDITAQPQGVGAGIHWQVAQATSLQNIIFNMRKGGGEANQQKGIFMDNGSGGFMTDLVFNGGGFGAFFGNQQFNTRNLTFNDCRIAMFMNWNWAWTFHGVTINNADIGLDMANGGSNSQTVGSVLMIDSVIRNSRVGINTAYVPSNPNANGTLILDNVDFAGTNVAVQGANRNQILGGNTKIASWVQGKAGTANNLRAVQAAQTAVNKPAGLLDGTGKVFTRSKPQYQGVPASQFLSVKDNGAKGDGRTDDTAAIQAIFTKAASENKIVFFDHGAYLITNTVQVPANIKITGEIWPLILAGGNSNFKNQNSPKPVFRVGNPGDKGAVEISDLMFETAGPQPGAILIEWNVEASSSGAAGMWDVHARVGGSAGTDLQMAQCAKAPQANSGARPQCMGAYMLMHIKPTAALYLENTWFWVADHDLEPEARNGQIDVFNGRGVLIESTKPVWMWGTASEHSVLYNYQLRNAANVFMAQIQTETPYFQGNPDAKTPFTVNAGLGDPDFTKCTSGRCARAWGFRAIGSKDILVYGAGLYSFFDNYTQQCVDQNNCQDHMVSLENSSVQFFGLSTKASVNMITVNGQSAALDRDHRSTFCGTIAKFSS